MNAGSTGAPLSNSFEPLRPTRATRPLTSPVTSATLCRTPAAIRPLSALDARDRVPELVFADLVRRRIDADRLSLVAECSPERAVGVREAFDRAVERDGRQDPPARRQLPDDPLRVRGRPHVPATRGDAAEVRPELSCEHDLVRARVDFPQLSRGGARDPECALRKGDVVDVARQDREALLHVSCLRVEPLDPGTWIECPVADPDRAGAGGDLPNLVRHDPFRGERKAVGHLVHARVDPKHRRGGSARHPDRSVIDCEPARSDSEPEPGDLLAGGGIDPGQLTRRRDAPEGAFTVREPHRVADGRAPDELAAAGVDEDVGVGVGESVCALGGALGEAHDERHGGGRQHERACAHEQAAAPARRAAGAGARAPDPGAGSPARARGAPGPARSRAPPRAACACPSTRAAPPPVARRGRARA